MTADKINLTQLRERALAAKHESRQYGVHPDVLLALIDTAETAIELFDDQPEIQADYPQLHETLNRFDFDHPTGQQP